jgi:hypothetical protein
VALHARRAELPIVKVAFIDQHRDALETRSILATWRGFVCVVNDEFARRIVDWPAASMGTDLAIDALEQAIYDRCSCDTRTSCITAAGARSTVDPPHRAPAVS